MTDSDDTLQAALVRYEFELPDSQVQQLQSYCRLLWDWNEKLNLTRHTDWEKFVTRDLTDSMQLSKHLEPDTKVMDVGTGGGVPGVVLAILRPDLEITLCDSVQKKARVVESMVRELDLPVPVYAERAEKVLDDFRFDTLVTRAVGPLWKICKWFKGRWQEFDCLLAVKGPSWTDERAAARERGLMDKIVLRKIDSYQMPGTESESVILRLAKR